MTYKPFLYQYFTHCENRHSVEYVISDMYEPYLLVTQIMFPKAKYVVDRFHYIRYTMDALDKVRIRLQKEYGYNSKEYRMLKNKKNVTLLRKYSNDIDWWTYTRRNKNGHQVDILKYDLREEILNISKELKISLMTYSTECLFSQCVKYWIRYSFFLSGNISNAFLWIGSFTIKAYFPLFVSALNSSKLITLGEKEMKKKFM